MGKNTLYFTSSKRDNIPAKFFKAIMPIGKPTHFIGKHNGWSACGVNCGVAAKDTQGVDCLRCRKTEAYKIGYMARNSGNK